MFGQRSLLTSRIDSRSIKYTTKGGVGGETLTSSSLNERLSDLKNDPYVRQLLLTAMGLVLYW